MEQKNLNTTLQNMIADEKKIMEVEKIERQILERYTPQRVILFGSMAKGRLRQNSDIDLCIVMNTQDKRRTLTDLYYHLETVRPVDIILYTPEEWEKCVSDSCSFAHKIDREGVVLYG